MHLFKYICKVKVPSNPYHSMILWF